MDLSLAIEAGAVHLGESVGLNSIDVGDDPRDVLVERGRYLTAEVDG
jgi:hypothetical protein